MNTQNRLINKFKNLSRRQLILISYLPIHFIWYFIVEQVNVDNYHVVYSPLDELIPFCEWFIIPYLLWFVYMVSAGIYYLLKDEEAFESYLLTLWTGFFLSLLFISIFPTGQELRPESFARDNPAIWAVKHIYAFDTNTNVFPSMHVIGALTVGVSVIKSKSLRKKRWVQIVSAISCVLICLATVFLKQHSVLDIFGGLVFYIAAHFIALGILKVLNKAGKTSMKINT